MSSGAERRVFLRLEGVTFLTAFLRASDFLELDVKFDPYDAEDTTEEEEEEEPEDGVWPRRVW